MAFGSAGGGRQSLTEINVTPLVDVMLVLLIVFMVTAPLIQQGVQVKLPQARAKAMPSEDQKLVLSLRGDRTVWLGTTEKPAEIALKDLEQKLRANERLQHDAALFIMADRSLPYGFVVEVFATAQRAGVTNIGLITDPREDHR